MGFFDNLFGGGQAAAGEAMAEAAEMAMRERRAAEQRARQDFRPYLEAGQRALPQYEGMINEMRDSPAFLDKLISGYQPSLGYQKRFDEGQRALTQSMNAGGMYGSGDFFKRLIEHGQGVADEDIQQYLANVLGIRDKAMGGYGGLTNLGQNSASNIANIAANTGQGLASDQLNLGNANAISAMGNANVLQGLLGLGGSMFLGGLGNSDWANDLSGWQQGAYQGLNDYFRQPRNNPYVDQRNNIQGQGIQRR